MRQLKFVGLSEDGTSLLLEASADEQFALPIDERLRAAARGDLTRLGQIEIELDAPLRPRDIQARVRAGESPEQLSNSTRTPLERVLRFAYPVLQEREQVTAEARRSRIRRGEGSQHRTLGELVDERLLARGVEPDSVEWDSWRREDGGWTVVARWREMGRSQVATWSFTLSTRTATTADDQSEELTAEHPPPKQRVNPVTPLAVASQQIPAEPPARTRARAAELPYTFNRAKSEIPTHPQQPQPAARESVREARESVREAREIREVREVREVREAREPSRGSGNGRRPVQVPSIAPSMRPRPAAAAAAATGPVEPEEDRAKRARVPSWDDILLGVRRKS